MNFKTTLALLVALIVVGAVVLFRGGKPEEPASTEPQRLFAVSSETVDSITVTPSSGDVIAMTKSTDGNWRLTKPVESAVDKFSADDLVRAITSLESRGQVDASKAIGLDQPQYIVNIQAGDKLHELVVGAAASVGSDLYVKADGGKQASLVAATLLEQLAKPASEYREKKLVAVSSDGFHDVSITQGGQTLALAKEGTNWSIVAPTTMPADPTAVSGLLSAISGLRANEFVTEGNDATAIGQPRLTISYSTTPTSTQPATPQPVKTIVFGRYSDISKQHVLATSPEINAVVTVPATSLDAFNKKPLDLRDKQVLALSSASVQTVDLKSDKIATTQPTTQPASSKQIVVTRRPPTPALSTTQTATTLPSTTQATATPPASKWTIGDAPANDPAVDAIVSALASLKAEKFVETVPVVAQPVATYTLVLTVPPTGPSHGERHELRVLDFGNDTPPVATYNSLNFEVSRTVLTSLAAELAKTP